MPALSSILEAGLSSRQDWVRAIEALQQAHGELIESAERHLDEDELMQLLSPLLFCVGRIGLSSAERAQRLFALGEGMGLHLLAAHYYSPVPDTRSLPSGLWAARREIAEALDLDVARQLAFLERISRWHGELGWVPETSEGGLCWQNPSLTRADATLYYSILRELRPARVIEVGGGFSTLVAAAAAVRNGDTELVCIEPHAPQELRAGVPGLARLVETPVQQVDSGLFESLETGDVVFVDGSHASKIGSDVNHLFTAVVPRLPPGVLLHFHDVFTPSEYPERWVRDLHIFWNEQYLVEAFLLHNSEFEILCLVNHLSEVAPDPVRRALGIPSGDAVTGSSAWLRRRP